MVQTVACCHDPTMLAGTPLPFSKMVVLDFYDGPTAGIIQCAGCGAVYSFDMLDWDQNHQVRIFRFASLPPDALDRCVAAFARTEPPRWPVWAPWFRTTPAETLRDEVNREVDDLLKQAQPAELVIAWTGYGDNVVAARRVPEEALRGVPDWFSRTGESAGEDWFSLLGLRERGNGKPPTSCRDRAPS